MHHEAMYEYKEHVQAVKQAKTTTILFYVWSQLFHAVESVFFSSNSRTECDKMKNHKIFKNVLLVDLLVHIWAKPSLGDSDIRVMIRLSSRAQLHSISAKYICLVANSNIMCSVCTGDRSLTSMCLISPKSTSSTNGRGQLATSCRRSAMESVPIIIQYGINRTKCIHEIAELWLAFE